MSLFKAREYWSVDLNVPDAFDGSSLLVEDINCRACICLGSHDGYFRAYSITNTEPSQYKPSDLLYETLFPAPVLQMTMACLVSGSIGRQLAVLHPKVLAVYLVQQAETDGETVLSLKHAYQHILPRASHSFVSGPFGRVTGRDFICVQSLDGLLSFFEQEAPTFETQLPDFLLPGPFVYLPSIDAFLFQNNNQYLTCYSYEQLSQSSQKPLWTHNIGEYVTHINCITVSDENVSILILTERCLYNLDELGKIKWMKQFDFQPICFYSFLNRNNNEIMTLICTEYEAIHVYEGTCMKWCFKLDFLPVSATLLDLGHLYGLIVVLSDSGFVQCVYMGTVPSLYLIPPTAEPEINVVDAEEELRRLQIQITDTELGNMDETVTIKLTVDSKVYNDDNKTFCNVNVELKTLTPINNIQVVFEIEPPLTSSVASTVVASVIDTETVVSKIYLAGPGPVSGLEVKAMVSYVMPNGVPRVAKQSAMVPFEITMVSCSAAKDAPVKLTIATNKPTYALNDLFPGAEGSANAVGLKYLNSETVVTIVAAKTSQRYRIQGDDLHDLSLVLSTLVGRLNSHTRRVADWNLTFGGPLPLQTYFSHVEMHYELITRKRLKQEQLAQRTTQYRTIQKKVLASLKDLNPKPNGALYKVLDDTYHMIKTVIGELEMLQLDLQLSKCRLAALTRLMTTLLQLMTLTQIDMELLKIAFNPTIFDNDEQGWLEVQNATLSLLLRTSLSKSSKDQNKPVEMTLEPLSDVSRLCKLFTTVVDRATKGTSLMERAEFDGERESLPTVPSVKEWDENEIKLVPKSAKFTDLNTPITHKPTVRKDGADQLDEKQEGIIVETEVIIEPTRELQEVEDVTVPKSVISPKKTINVPKASTINHVENALEGKIQSKREPIPDEDSIWDITIDEMKI